MAISSCPTCSGTVSQSAAFCPHCGHPGSVANALTVDVKDIHMDFLSMVSFMVKWAIASIPALIFLVIIGAFAYGLLVAKYSY